jgi:hypothetical protein
VVVLSFLSFLFILTITALHIMYHHLWVTLRRDAPVAEERRNGAGGGWGAGGSCDENGVVILMTNMLYSISRNHGSTTGHESPSGCSCSLVDTANDLVRDHRVAFQIEPYIALSRGCLLHCPVVDEDGSSRTAGIRNRDRTVVMAGTPDCPSSAIVVILSPLRSLVSLSSLSLFAFLSSPLKAHSGSRAHLSENTDSNLPAYVYLAKERSLALWNHRRVRTALPFVRGAEIC